MAIANITAADDVARILHDLELQIDLAYERAGELAAALPRARRDNKLSAVVGQPVFAHLAQSMGALGEARGHLVAMHRSVEAVAKATGIEVRAWGDEHPKPPVTNVDAGAPRLSVAA
jgi:hypothetical protein